VLPLVLGWMFLFGDKSNKHIKLIYLTTMDNYAAMGNYSWGGMTLSYLCHCISEVSLHNDKALGGSTTLLMIINCITRFNLNIFFSFSWPKLINVICLVCIGMVFGTFS